jgi:hypothetical protein
MVDRGPDISCIVALAGMTPMGAGPDPERPIVWVSGYQARPPLTIEAA